MPNQSEVQEQTVGTHPTRFEPPDLYVITFEGDYLEEHIQAHSKLFEEGPDHFYIVLDTTRLGAVTGAPLCASTRLRFSYRLSRYPRLR